VEGTMKSFRTTTEQEIGNKIETIFGSSQDAVEIKLQNFTKYVRRQDLKRFLAMYEIFKRVLTVKGSIVDCGVYRGFSLMAWAKLSTILEPENLTRRIYGFDTFQGFPSVNDQDRVGHGLAKLGDFDVHSSYEELLQLIAEYDRDRFLGHIPKIELVQGDATKSIPEFVLQHPHLVVSLLFMDFDLYQPTRAALEHFVPRMPRGSILAFDELDNPIWPGETMALLESMRINRLSLQRLEWDPYITFAVID